MCVEMEAPVGGGKMGWGEAGRQSQLGSGRAREDGLPGLLVEKSRRCC